MKKTTPAENLFQQGWTLTVFGFATALFSLISIGLFFHFLTGFGYGFFAQLHIAPLLFPAFYISTAISAITAAVSYIILRNSHVQSNKSFIGCIFVLSAIAIFMMLVLLLLTLIIGFELNSH